MIKKPPYQDTRVAALTYVVWNASRSSLLITSHSATESEVRSNASPIVRTTAKPNAPAKSRCNAPSTPPLLLRRAKLATPKTTRRPDAAPRNRGSVVFEPPYLQSDRSVPNSVCFAYPSSSHGMQASENVPRTLPAPHVHNNSTVEFPASSVAEPSGTKDGAHSQEVASAEATRWLAGVQRRQAAIPGLGAA